MVAHHRCTALVKSLSDHLVPNHTEMQPPEFANTLQTTPCGDARWTAPICGAFKLEAQARKSFTSKHNRLRVVLVFLGSPMQSGAVHLGTVPQIDAGGKGGRPHSCEAPFGPPAAIGVCPLFRRPLLSC